MHTLDINLAFNPKRAAQVRAFPALPPPCTYQKKSVIYDGHSVTEIQLISTATIVTECTKREYWIFKTYLTSKKKATHSLSKGNTTTSLTIQYYQQSHT